MSLFDNPVLFRAWGTDWRVTSVCWVTGVLLLLLAGPLGWILARHSKGMQWQTMSSQEAADLAANAGRAPHERLGQVYSGKAVGGEMRFGVNDLRQAARRGDWLTFWLVPILFSCIFGGLSLFFAGIFSGAILSDLVCRIFIISFFVIGVGAAWFMAWAAIFTNIDAGTAQQSSGQERGPGR